MSQAALPQHDTPSAEARKLAPLLRRLRRVRRTARWMLVGHRLATLATIAIAVTLGAGLIDYALRTPDALRWIVLALGAAGVLTHLWRRVRPAARFCPSLTDVALRLEAPDPSLRGYLASAVDFALHARGSSDALTSAMERRVVAEAADRVRTAHAGRVLRPAKPARRGLLLVTAAGVVIALATASPTLVSIGAQRLFAPWRGVEWPRRTEVADNTGASVHPIGRALPLRASLLRTPRAPGETRVEARYRIIVDGRPGPTRRAPMSPQASNTQGHELFERLVEPALPSGTQQAALEYWFETEDDQTPSERVRLIEPPTITGISANITPPAYVRSTDGPFASGAIELSLPAPEAIGPVLAGSRVELVLQLSRVIDPPDDAAARAQTFGERGLPVGATLRANDQAWTLEWTAADPVALSVRPIDADGIAAFDATTFALNAVPDRPASAALLEPVRDEAVLATAVVAAVAETRDDVGLASAAIERVIARRTDGADAAPEGEPQPVAQTAPIDTPMRVTLEAAIDLAELVSDGEPLAPGDEVWLQAVAQDTFDLGGTRHTPARSSVRRLIIIDEDTLAERLRSELGGLRRGAMRLDEQQRQLAEDVRAGVVGERTSEQQAGITERLGAQRDLVQRLRDRQARNRLHDDALQDLLDRSGDALARASEASEAARDALDQAATDGDATAREQAEDAQQDVRDQIGRLMELLDRGEDGWLARRSVERALAEQREIAERTAELAQDTVGRDASELTRRQRGALEQLAQDQAAAAEATEDALEELESRAESLQADDPSTARALAEAAQRGRENQVSERQASAGEQIQQNQTSSAQQSQQQAIQSLEQMLEDLDRAEQRREESLRRFLAEAVDRVRRLIERQQQELDRLEAAAPTGAFGGLDAALIDLREATLAAADTIRNESPDYAPIARTVERAAESQASAVVALRQDTVLADDVRADELEALAQLQAALEALEREADDAEDAARERAREELRLAYSEALREQVSIRADTELFQDRDLSRRERAELRRVAERQLALRAQLEALRTETEGLEDALMFVFAHDRLDRVGGRAGERLRSGLADAGVARDQEAISSILRGLIQALEQDAPEEEFRENEDGGGGGGGGGNGGASEDELVPPVAQLKLLRAMQAEALERTRAANAAGAEADALELEDVRDLQRALNEHAQSLITMLEQQQGAQPGGER